jgi:hypothetical protein
MTTDDVQALHAEVERVLGNPASWPPPVEFQDSLALCALNSVYSLQSGSAAGRNVFRRYRTFRLSVGADANHDNGSDLLEAIDSAGGPEPFATDVLVNRGTLRPTGRLKSEGLHEGVGRLVAVGVNTTAELRGLSAEGFLAVGCEWRKTHGLGQASWDYLTMNAGIADGMKVDRMVRRFFRRAVGEPSGTIADSRIKSAFSTVAVDLGTDLRSLDHAVWDHESPQAKRP